MFQFRKALGRSQREAQMNRARLQRGSFPRTMAYLLSLSRGRARTWERFMGSVSRKGHHEVILRLQLCKGEGCPGQSQHT